MCAIYGFFGFRKNFDAVLFDKLRQNAGDRGRDGHGEQLYDLTGDLMGIIGLWRGAPTHELQFARKPPYDGIVLNGTIVNDKYLGIQPGEIDSEVLPRVLNRNSLADFQHSLKQIIGSFAIACHSKDMSTIYAAVNYKPLHYWSPNSNDVYFSSMERHFNGIVPFGSRPVALDPYTCIDFRTKQTLILPRSEGAPPTALMIMSAGLDSTVALADLIHKKYKVSCLYFKYGCRTEDIEFRHAKNIAEYYDIPFYTVTLNYDQMKGKSSIMTNEGNIGKLSGMEYAHQWVPARNLVMLANATAFAEANGYHYIALGNNLEESGSHPDNEEQFTHLFDKTLDYAVNLNYKLRLVSPLGHLMKTEIVKRGIELYAPFRLSYSCYNGKEKHCGRCGSCMFRLNAFKRAGYIDPVEYTDSRYEELPSVNFWEGCIDV